MTHNWYVCTKSTDKGYIGSDLMLRKVITQTLLSDRIQADGSYILIKILMLNCEPLSDQAWILAAYVGL